ncbi:MAG: putative DNA binding domain-containing protein [Deltaproteobacteria bacterium]|nr:putative DNA binding domain-containing protein [Deltaproteobacteria bacterium]
MTTRSDRPEAGGAAAAGICETEQLDCKSLRLVTGRTADFDELARDCVCFANGSGGKIVLGVEDRHEHPPADQRVDQALLDRIRKRIGELTVNVQVLPEIHHDANGGEYVVVAVPRSVGVASTGDGRYFVRIGDTCRPVVGDDVLRLADERPAVPWETMTSLGILTAAADRAELEKWTAAIRASGRVNASVKEKSDAELLDHYALARGSTLTNLGVLLLGTAADRARLGSAPIIQAIKFDERGEKVGKYVWDDYTLSPTELIDAVWAAIPDFRESYELPDGMFRTAVPAFEEAVVRELLVNALVHRPYTQRGDIFLNLHPDQLEIVNPGRLPIGVSPRNILHVTRRRNEGMARVFHDLGLMEREGSGFDLLYERLLASGRGAPMVREGADSVHVTIPRRVIQPGVIQLVVEADKRYQLTQRERIALGLLAQTEGLSAAALAERLELEDPAASRPWIDRLLERGLVEQTGRGRGTGYLVPPALLRKAGLDRLTTLTGVQPHRLRALILEDLRRFPDSSASEVHRRVGSEIPERTFRRALENLTTRSEIVPGGAARWRRYRVGPGHGQQ